MVETQINPVLLSRQSDFKDNLFQSEVNHAIFVNNSNELIELRQQGRVISSARDKIAKFCIGSSSDLL